MQCDLVDAEISGPSVWPAGLRWRARSCADEILVGRSGA